MSLTREELHDLLLAGKVVHLAMDQIAKYVKPKVSIGSLYDTIVKIITTTKGVDVAFPPNISINETAAHDSAGPIEKRVIPKKALVKIDIGANVNGMLSDTAKTFSTDGKHFRLIKSAKDALNNAIDIIKPNLRVSEIGAVIQETIEDYGFKPIANLTGHEMKKGTLHAGLSIPSVKSVPFAQRSKLKKGMVLAIEPFSTPGGAGYVEEGSTPPLIYSSKGNPKTDIGKILVKRYQRLPFSLRSATLYLKKKNISTDNLREIINKDNFYGYHPLVEKTRGLVAQAEHTVLVTSNGARIIT
ncbi:MAG: type II methionyl aminopeptidase [Candidatus Heimdallarchaeota archaeon]|nr:MAG: type II methionyl aminopeptidase [Candidatus Heimdallarchaeota archaeon]